MSNRNNIPIGIDGHQRATKDDLKISQNIEALFNGPLGGEVLLYLKSITINMVSGPEITDRELRHLEGQRYLVGLIERRMNHAINKRKS